jgi:hypothetical protein
MNDLWLNLLEFIGRAWWIEILTESPNCAYYFGPFANQEEAGIAKQGYLEDLQREGATNIRSTIKQCKPDPARLTIYDESADKKMRISASPVLSRQL